MHRKNQRKEVNKLESALKSVFDKVSSYDLFNNFFPGLVFCCVLEQSTRFTLETDSVWERLFMFYFVGMVLSRIGSICVESVLRKWKVLNKETNQKEPFLKYAHYEHYIEASEAQPTIGILLEKNNMYRTMVAVFILLIPAKLFDWILYDFIQELLPVGNVLIFIMICALLIILYAYSCRKQTTYIRKRVEKYMREKIEH